MIIYEVNITVADKVFNDYITWLMPHIKEILCFDGFISANYYQELRHQCDDKSKLIVQYQIENLNFLDDYLKNNAAKMRRKANDDFAGLVSFERRILRLEDDFVKSEEVEHC